MQTIVFRGTAVCIGGCAAALAVVGGLLNWKGAAMMAPGEAALLMSCAAVIAEPLKLVWMSGFREAQRLGATGAAIAVLVMGVFLHGFSMMAAIGLAGAGRIEATGDRGAMQEKHRRAQAAYAEAQARVEKSRGHRLPQAVEADLRQTETDLAGARSREEKERQPFCGARCDQAIAEGETARRRILALQSELSLSRQAEEARRDLDAAHKQLDTAAAPASTDPQAEAIAAFLPFLNAAWVSGKLLPLLPSLLVEFTPPVFMMLATLFWQAGGGADRRETPAPTEDKTGISACQDALNRVRAMILAAPERQLVASKRKLAGILGVAPSTFQEWVEKWRQNGQISLQLVTRGKTVFELPRAGRPSSRGRARSARKDA